MKILLALHGMPPEFVGGSEIYVERLARVLIEHGNECEILCGSRADPGNPGIEATVSDGLSIHRLRRPDRFHDRWLDTHSVFAERAIDRFLGESGGFDVLHIHHWKRLTPNLSRIGLRHGIGSVISLHDLWTTCPREYRLLPEGFCREPAGSLACSSCVPPLSWESESEIGRKLAFHLAQLREEFEIASVRTVPSEAHAVTIRELLGPLDLEILAPSFEPAVEPAREAFESRTAVERFPRGPLRIGYFGHLVAFKGAHVLLRAVAETDTPERYRVELFGEAAEGDPYGAELQELVKGLQVVQHGAYAPEDIDRSGVDVAIIPSECHESYSIVLDEVFSAGIPAIVSDVGAMSERLGANGAVFRAGDVEGLARILTELTDEPARLVAWREGLPRRRSSAEEHVERVMEMYEKAGAANSDQRPVVVAPRASSHEEALAIAEAALDSRQRLLEELSVDAERVPFLQAEIERHREVQRRLGEEGEELREMVRSLEGQLGEHRAVLEETRRDLAEHRAVGEARTREITEHRETTEVLRRDLEDHRSVLRDLHAERERLLGDAESLVAQVRERDDSLKELALRLEQELTRAGTAVEELEALRIEHAARVDELERVRSLADANEQRALEAEAWVERARDSKLVRLALLMIGSRGRRIRESAESGESKGGGYVRGESAGEDTVGNGTSGAEGRVVR